MSTAIPRAGSNSWRKTYLLILLLPASQAVLAQPDQEVLRRIAALKEVDDGKRREAAEDLQMMGPAAGAATPALIAALKDEDARVREAVAGALAGIGPAAGAATPALVAALKDKDSGVRRVAAWALGRIGPAARDAIPKLRDLSMGPNGRLTEVVQEALLSIEGGTDS
jgi:HEAT repeat protein